MLKALRFSRASLEFQLVIGDIIMFRVFSSSFFKTNNVLSYGNDFSERLMVTNILENSGIFIFIFFRKAQLQQLLSRSPFCLKSPNFEVPLIYNWKHHPNTKALNQKAGMSVEVNVAFQRESHHLSQWSSAGLFISQGPSFLGSCKHHFTVLHTCRSKSHGVPAQAMPS